MSNNMLEKLVDALFPWETLIAVPGRVYQINTKTGKKRIKYSREERQTQEDIDWILEQSIVPKETDQLGSVCC